MTRMYNGEISRGCDIAETHTRYHPTFHEWFNMLSGTIFRKPLFDPDIFIQSLEVVKDSLLKIVYCWEIYNQQHDIWVCPNGDLIPNIFIKWRRIQPSGDQTWLGNPLFIADLPYITPFISVYRGSSISMFDFPESTLQKWYNMIAHDRTWCYTGSRDSHFSAGLWS